MTNRGAGERRRRNSDKLFAGLDRLRVVACERGPASRARAGRRKPPTGGGGGGGTGRDEIAVRRFNLRDLRPRFGPARVGASQPPASQSCVAAKHLDSGAGLAALENKQRAHLGPARLSCRQIRRERTPSSPGPFKRRRSR
jgi:hypothetical protein